MNILIKSLAATLLLSAAGAAMAQEPPPIYCVDFQEIQCPEGNRWAVEYLTDGDDFCYRVKLMCNRGVEGGATLDLQSDGGVGVGMGLGVPPYQGCGGFFGHLGNEQFTHGCDFGHGRFAWLYVSKVKYKFCRNETQQDCPPPPPPP